MEPHYHLWKSKSLSEKCSSVAVEQRPLSFLKSLKNMILTRPPVPVSTACNLPLLRALWKPWCVKAELINFFVLHWKTHQCYFWFSNCCAHRVCQQKPLQFVVFFSSHFPTSVNEDRWSQPATDPDPLPGTFLSMENPGHSQLPAQEGWVAWGGAAGKCSWWKGLWDNRGPGGGALFWVM